MSRRVSLSNALEQVLQRKKGLAEAQAAHAEALERLRNEAPDGEFLIRTYVSGEGFGNYLLEKGEDGGLTFRRVDELPEEPLEKLDPVPVPDLPEAQL